MSDLFDGTGGQTPLTPEEMEGLIPPAIATRGDLNLFEEKNITDAREWLFKSKHADFLTDVFVRELHRRMFNHIWKWAGSYRTSVKNLGVAPEQIAVMVRELCEDARLWRDRGVYLPDEAAVRLHHRLVSIHPFSNGNGRHARLFSDLFLAELGAAPASWGARQAEAEQETTPNLRERYIASLRAADRGDYSLLTLFMRS